jgi:hypothetical protein
MADPLYQICLMAQMLAGATRTSVVHYSSANNSLEIVQRSSGFLGTIDGKHRLPILNAENPVLSAPDVRKVKEFKNHPFMQYMPNLRSLQAYFFQSQDKEIYYFTICNPRPDFFSNVQMLDTIEQLVEVVWSILSKPTQAEQTMLEISSASKLEAGLAEAVNAFDVEPTTQFLDETLIKKQRLLARNGASYLALRKWRKPIKPYQVAAMDAIRRHAVRPIADVIATEMAEAVKRLFGDTFQTIVPMPRDNYKLGNCLAAQIAERLAKKLKIQVANVLVPMTPSKIEDLLSFTLQRPVFGNVLILDDVATTGRHMDMATKALAQGSSHCTGLVWIAA